MSSSATEANPSTRKKPVQCPDGSVCCPATHKCIKDKTVTACRECFIEVKRLRRNHKIKMDALKEKHKVTVTALEKKHKVDNEKYQKLISIGEKRLSDERGALQKAAEKDKRSAFWTGLVWGIGGTFVVVLVGTAVVVIYSLVTTAGKTALPLTIRQHQPLFIEGVFP